MTYCNLQCVYARRWAARPTTQLEFHTYQTIDPPKKLHAEARRASPAQRAEREASLSKTLAERFDSDIVMMENELGNLKADIAAREKEVATLEADLAARCKARSEILTARLKELLR